MKVVVELDINDETGVLRSVYVDGKLAAKTDTRRGEVTSWTIVNNVYVIDTEDN